MDYVFDQSEMNDYIKARPDIFPPEKGYDAVMAMIEPERIPCDCGGAPEAGL